MTAPRKRRASKRSVSQRRVVKRHQGWPWWARLVIGGGLLAGVVFAVLWFNALASWIKIASVTSVVVLVVFWWLWSRRADIRDEMDRRAAGDP